MTTSNPTDWSAWPALSPGAVRTRLQRRLNRPIANNDLIALYNQLMPGLEHNPAKVAEQAEALTAVFQARCMNAGAVLFLELAARAWGASGETARSLQALEKMPPLVSTHRERIDLLELTDDIWSGLARPPFPHDAAPIILASFSRVFRTLGDLERLAKVYLGDLFEDHGALTASTRLLRDAETLAREIGSLSLLAGCYERLASVAYRERTFDDVLTLGETAAEVHREMGAVPPPWLMNTMATALMHLDRDFEAASMYESAILLATEKAILTGLWMNLAAARRKLRDLSGAENAIGKARELVNEEVSPEFRLELELIAARIAAQALRLDQASAYLNRGVELMANILQPVLRLHRRRGLRDRYVRRFEGVMAEFPDRGSLDAVLPALATIRGTMSADWMSLLAWSAACRCNDRVGRSDREALCEVIDRIKAVGAPFLYGYREKYDDPWEPFNYAQPWDDLSMLLRRLVPIVGIDPYAGADLTRSVALLRGRLAEGYVLVVPTVAHATIRLWVLSGDTYRHIDLDPDATRDIFVQREMYQQASINRDDFAASLDRSLDVLAAQAMPIFGDALAVGARGILYFQEPLDQLPLFALAGRHDGVRRAMSAGEFELRFTPILYPQHPPTVLAGARLLSMTDERDADLLLARFEGTVAADLMDASAHDAIQSDDRKAFAKSISEADVLLVSTHGDSIVRFVDPHFAKLGRGDHAINVRDLQEIMPTTHVRLVILNACDSGAGTHRNLYGAPRTHDIASYPGLMLLNSKACIGAAGWRISDTTGFVFTCLIAGFIGKGDEPTKALCRASATLRDLKKSEVLAFLDHLPDVMIRETAKARIAGAPEDGMFSRAYASGGLQLVTLV
jgi:tetratricopeptide (TPR) repeat protein